MAGVSVAEPVTRYVLVDACPFRGFADYSPDGRLVQVPFLPTAEDRSLF